MSSAATTRPTRTIHVSKSSAALFERCPLAYSYEKVEHREPDFDDVNEAQLAGTAAHAAVAALLPGYAELAPSEADRVVAEALDEFGLRTSLRDKIAGWAFDAAALAAERGGQACWVEEMKTMVRIPGVTVWGKFDVTIAGGTVAPLEIIDWTFGRGRAANEDELRAALGTIIYRLIAGAHELELRPIAVTEAHIPSGSTITVTLTDEEVVAGWNRLKEIAADIRAAVEAAEFPPRTGVHCSYCPYRASCPAVAAGSDAVPL